MWAKDIMTTDVVTVDPNDGIALVARRLLDHRISAAPVIDHNGHLRGIVSEADLMRRAKCDRGHHWWLSLFEDRTTEFVRHHGTRARDVMTDDVISIGKDATLAEIARILESHAIKCVPVLEAGHLVGVVSRSDILRGLASLTSAGGVNASVNDLAARERILDLLKKKTSASLQAVSIIVLNGVVYLWGIADTEEQRAAIRVAAENVVGTGNVRDHLNTLSQVLRGV